MLKDLLFFLSFYNSAKLFHFSTKYYSAHKSSDDFANTYLTLLDKFWEVYQGKYEKLTVNKEKEKKIYIKLWTDKSIHSELDNFITFLYDSTLIKMLEQNNDTEMLNIRDELVGHINQFKYLLKFK